VIFYDMLLQVRTLQKAQRSSAQAWMSRLAVSSWDEGCHGRWNGTWGCPCCILLTRCNLTKDDATHWAVAEVQEVDQRYPAGLKHCSLELAGTFFNIKFCPDE